MRTALLVAGLSILLSGCGYHVSGHADLMPKTVQTICVPAFHNATVKYQLTDRLAEAVAREFITRTRYHIVSDPEKADAVLRGTVVNYISYPTVFDPATGRASTIQFMVVMQARLVERATGKLLYNSPNFTIRNQYEVSTTARPYFEESDTALDRLSREVAQKLVSSILENF